MILENEDIKVEYELDEKGNIITSTVVKKNSDENKSALKILDKYIYIHEKSGIVLEFEIITDEVFKLKVNGTNIPRLEVLKPLAWLVEDYVESVFISDEVYVHVEDYFLDGGEFDKELLDLFSEGFIENIQEYKKGREAFVLNTLEMFRNSTPSELRKLIYYMKDIAY